MQFLVYILVYPFIWLISILPFRLLYTFSDVLYFFIYHVFQYRRKVVKEHLNMVFPEKSKKEITTITHKFYHHFCDMIVESFKSLSITESQINKRFKFTNIEEIHKLEKLNKSIVLMCAHYASWEWIFILQKHIKYKGYAIYKQLENKYFDRLVKRIRAKYKTYLITTKDTIPTLIKAKKEGELTINGFASDQTPRFSRAFYWNHFLGVKVPIHTGAEMLAKKLDMSVVFLKVKRVKRGFYEASFKTIAINPNEFKNFEITDIFTKL
ncbi:MAG: lysophospholipid acyltransferase family protein, partial [Gelidibacter sp.]|nr:lysophospholipid acyltransferase family protein [Gelidibacter sp.]